MYHEYEKIRVSLDKEEIMSSPFLLQKDNTNVLNQKGPGVPLKWKRKGSKWDASVLNQ